METVSGTAVSGTTVKQALNFLKAYRGSFAGLEGVEVVDSVWRSVDTGVEAVVEAPFALPNGVYNLFDVIPVLTSAAIEVELETWGVRINGCPVARTVDALPVIPTQGSRYASLGVIPEGWAMLQNHASPSESRPILNGIYLDPSAGAAVSTDGTRLAKITWDAVRTLPGGVTIPNLPIKDKNMAMSILFDGDRAESIVLMGSIGTVKARVLKGNYPDWARVMPDKKACPLTALVDRDRLHDWAKQAHALAKSARCPMVDIIQGSVEMGNQQTAKVSPVMALLEKNSIKTRGEVGEAWMRQEGTILVNTKFLLDATKNYPKSVQLEMALSGPQSPLIFTAGTLTALVLPIRQLK